MDDRRPEPKPLPERDDEGLLPDDERPGADLGAAYDASRDEEEPQGWEPDVPGVGDVYRSGS